MTRLLLAVVLVPAAVTPAAADPLAEEIRGKVRSAVGYDAWVKLEHGVVLTGTARAHGVTAPFTFHLHPDGRYAQREAMPLGVDDGFDGKGWWGRGFTTPPLPADLVFRDELRFKSGLLGHRWLAPGGGFTVTLDPAEHRAYRPCLVVQHPDAPAAVARAYVDPETWLPTRFVVTLGRTVSVFEPGDWRVVGGARVPARVGRAWTPGASELVATTVAAAGSPAPGTDPFAPPPPTADTTFDPATPARAEAKLVNNVLAVRVAMNGRPGVWLGLNAASGMTQLTPAAADRLGLPVFGRGTGVGVGIRTVGQRKVDRLAVGPAAVTDVVVWESPGAEAHGLDGYLGTDVLARVVAEADFGAGTLSVHAPKTYRPSVGAVWQEARFANGMAYLTGTIERAHTGHFMFATANPDPLLVWESAGRKLRLLNERPLRPIAAGPDGAAGAYEGTTREFNVLGRAARDVQTCFFNTPVAGETFPHDYGAISPSVLGPGTVVFDYPNRRIGFVPRPY